MIPVFYLPDWNWTNHPWKLTSSLLQISLSPSFIDSLCTFQSTYRFQLMLTWPTWVLAQTIFKALVTSFKCDPDLGGNFRCFWAWGLMDWGMLLECKFCDITQKYFKNSGEEAEGGNPSQNCADIVVWAIKQGRYGHEKTWTRVHSPLPTGASCSSPWLSYRFPRSIQVARDQREEEEIWLRVLPHSSTALPCRHGFRDVLSKHVFLRK